MLAQLLRQRGVEVQSVRNAQASRDEIGALALGHVDAVVISYLELTGSPADLRYLVKRLRLRAAGAKIIAGLWPTGEAALSNADIQQAMGADGYATSLRAAVDDVLNLPQADPSKDKAA